MLRTPTVTVKKLGLIPYRDALLIQKDLCQGVIRAKPDLPQDTVLVLEHRPVYTVGIRSREYDEKEELRLRSLGAEFVRTNRGGLITFHGPGQLVIYPVLNLGHFHPRKSMKWYIGQLELCGISVCKNYGLSAITSEHTGVWLGDKKIAAIGVHGSRFVTTHGIALNCNIDLNWFEHIIPCGIPNKGVTSFSQELQRNVTVDEVTHIFLKAFQEVFQCKLKYTQEENKH